MHKTSVEFSAFLQRFPEIELPVTLTDESISDFERNNDPLTLGMIRAFIDPEDGNQAEEFVEYVPCFRVPETHDFHAIIVWRGDLMKYRYLLMTYDKQGNLKASATIAGTESDGQAVLRSVATLDKDWIIHIVEGDHATDQTVYTPTNSRAYRMELLATGEIIFLLDEIEDE